MWSCWRRTLFTFVLLCYFSLFVRFFLFLQCTKTDSLAETKKKWGEFFVVVVFFKKKVKYKWNLFPIWIRIQLHDINPIFFKLSFDSQSFFSSSVEFFFQFFPLFLMWYVYIDFRANFFFAFPFLWIFIATHCGTTLFATFYTHYYTASFISNRCIPT